MLGLFLARFAFPGTRVAIDGWWQTGIGWQTVFQVYVHCILIIVL